MTDPASFSYYVYAWDNPVNVVDPSRQFPPFDNWEQWVDGVLNASATPAYAPADECDFANLEAQVQARGTGRAIPAMDAAYEGTEDDALLAGLLLPGLDAADAPVVAGRLGSVGRAGGAAGDEAGGAARFTLNSCSSLRSNWLKVEKDP